MLISLVLLPNIFKLNEPLNAQYCFKYSNLNSLLNIIRRRALIVLDKKGFLQAEISENLYNIENDNIKLELKHLFKTIETGYSKKIEVENNYAGELNQACGIFISLLNKNGSFNGVFAEAQECSECSCKECITNRVSSNLCTNISEFEGGVLSEALNKSNIIVNRDCNIDAFKDNIIKPFVENSVSIIIYDEQISNLNQNSSDISENFKRNIFYWVDYIYSVNNTISLKFYTTIKDIGNSIQTKRKLEEISKQIQEKYSKSNFEIKIVHKKLHERYFCSDKIIFSCDKGIDIVNNSGELIDNIHLSVLENSEAKKIRLEIEQM